MSKLIVGVVEIKSLALHDIILKYYNDTGDGFWAGPPIEAVETAMVEPTGKWRIAGDVDNQRMEIEVDVDWKTTPRTLRWRFGWPMTYVEKKAPDIHGTTVWVSEHRFDWMTQYNEQICGCAHNTKEDS